MGHGLYRKGGKGTRGDSSVVLTCCGLRNRECGRHVAASTIYRERGGS